MMACDASGTLNHQVDYHRPDTQSALVQPFDNKILDSFPPQLDDVVSQLFIIYELICKLTFYKYHT